MKPKVSWISTPCRWVTSTSKFLQASKLLATNFIQAKKGDIIINHTAAQHTMTSKLKKILTSILVMLFDTPI
jgi:hypothetical protein